MANLILNYLGKIPEHKEEFQTDLKNYSFILTQSYFGQLTIHPSTSLIVQ